MATSRLSQQELDFRSTGSTTRAKIICDTDDLFKLEGAAAVTRITVRGVATPTNDADAVPKDYVDNLVNGISWKDSVVVASAAQVTTLAGVQTIDGVVVSTGDRVLIKNGTASNPNGGVNSNRSVDNGIYVVDTSTTWSRSTDLAEGDNAAAAAVFAEAGTTNADKAFVCTNDPGSDVVGTNSLAFVQFSATSPAGGNDTDVQFNNGGSLGGNSGFTYNKDDTSPIVNIGTNVDATEATLNIGDASTGTTNLQGSVSTAVNVFTTTTTGDIAFATGLTTGSLDIGNTTMTGTIAINNDTTMNLGANSTSLNVGGPSAGTVTVDGTTLIDIGPSTPTNVNMDGVFIELGTNDNTTTTTINALTVNAGTSATFVNIGGGSAGTAVVVDGGTIQVGSTSDTSSTVINGTTVNAGTSATFVNVGGSGSTTDVDGNTVTVGSTANTTTTTINGDVVDVGTNTDSTAINIGNSSAIVSITGGAGVNTQHTNTDVQITGHLGVSEDVFIAGGKALFFDTSGTGTGIIQTEDVTGATTVSVNVGSLTVETGTNASGGTIGDLTIQGGAHTGSGDGGDVVISGGAASSGAGGDVTIQPGVGSTSVGNVRIAAGGGTVSDRVLFDSTSGTQVGYFDGTGEMYMVAFNATSDVQFKTNIQPLSDPLNTLKKIEGYQYDWKEDFHGSSAKKQIGVLAQQLEEVGLGNLVNGTEYKAVNYLGLIPILIEAVKELSGQVESLKKQ